MKNIKFLGVILIAFGYLACSEKRQVTTEKLICVGQQAAQKLQNEALHKGKIVIDSAGQVHVPYRVPTYEAYQEKIVRGAALAATGARPDVSYEGNELVVMTREELVRHRFKFNKMKKNATRFYSTMITGYLDVLESLQKEAEERAQKSVTQEDVQDTVNSHSRVRSDVAQVAAECKREQEEKAQKKAAKNRKKREAKKNKQKGQDASPAETLSEDMSQAADDRATHASAVVNNSSDDEDREMNRQKDVQQVPAQAVCENSEDEDTDNDTAEDREFKALLKKIKETDLTGKTRLKVDFVLSKNSGDSQ